MGAAQGRPWIGRRPLHAARSPTWTDRRAHWAKRSDRTPCLIAGSATVALPAVTRHAALQPARPTHLAPMAGGGRGRLAAELMPAGTRGAHLVLWSQPSTVVRGPHRACPCVRVVQLCYYCLLVPALALARRTLYICQGNTIRFTVVY